MTKQSRSELRASACIRVMLMLMLMLMAGAGWAYDPPRIIGHLTASAPSVDDFATDFVCVGDQNGDGFDDLLVNHGTWRPRQGDRDFSNRVELYFGGNPMDSIPDFVISGPPRGPFGVGVHINFVGRLTESENPYWALQRVEPVNNGRDRLGTVIIFEAGNALDNQYDYVLSSRSDESIMIGLGRRTNPIDLNGDGYNDLVTMRALAYDNDVIRSSLDVHYGGEEFDTIPDISFQLNTYTNPESRFENCSISGGLDINNDNNDDLLVRYVDTHNLDSLKYKYSLYLGGDPMDTVAVWEFYEDRFQDTLMNRGFAMVPDVNGDGFDDWVIHYWVDDVHHDPTWRQGYYLFYGSRNPDPDYDFRLDGAPSAWGADGEVIGGDVNGDGFGDIIMTSEDGYTGDGSIQISFGSRWYEGRIEISTNCLREYGELANGLGVFLGGVGDFNNDGKSDFVTQHHGGRPNSGVSQGYIFGGQRNWRVDASPETVPRSFDLTLSTTPNPFNNTIRLQYTVSGNSAVKLEIFDISGRLVAELERNAIHSEPAVFDWQSESTGVFIVSLSAEHGGIYYKRILQKIVCIR